MVKPKFKINVFDFFAIIAVILVIVIGLISLYNKPSLGGNTVFVTIKITDADKIEAALPFIKSNTTVFFSGTKYPVKQASYRIEKSAAGKTQALYVNLQGPGEIETGNSIFNGQRVYINEKAEIRADYQVQGYIVDFGNVIN